MVDDGNTLTTTVQVTERKCDDRREFQFLVGGALAICLGLQGLLMWRLMTAQPPDSSWDLIKSLMSHLGQVDVLLIGGLLGMAQQKGNQ